MTRQFLVGTVLALVALPVNADVWEYRDDGEVTLHRTLDHLQRQRLSQQWQVPAESELAKRRARYDSIIQEQSRKHGVDPDLIHAIVQIESAYDPSAASKAGALGLMQLMPATAERFGVIDALDPLQNIDAGIRYLKALANQFDTLELVLAAYNAGEDAVERYGRTVPPYPETQRYVSRLLTMMDRHKSLFD